VRVSDLKGELEQKNNEISELTTQKTRLEERVAALESVGKKLDRLKQSNVLLVQAKVGIERLSRQLADIAESPDAQVVSPDR
jgi:chaperonin cofactor prefoldin